MRLRANTLILSLPHSLFHNHTLSSTTVQECSRCMQGTQCSDPLTPQHPLHAHSNPKTAQVALHLGLIAWLMVHWETTLVLLNVPYLLWSVKMLLDKSYQCDASRVRASICIPFLSFCLCVSFSLCPPPTPLPVHLLLLSVNPYAFTFVCMFLHACM
jgi:hypothetical protein